MIAFSIFFGNNSDPWIKSNEEDLHVGYSQNHNLPNDNGFLDDDAPFSDDGLDDVASPDEAGSDENMRYFPTFQSSCACPFLQNFIVILAKNQ